MTTATASTIIPTPVLTFAHKIARFYGHEWATCFELEELVGLTDSGICAKTDMAYPGSFNAAPTYNEDGMFIRHTTVTGRLVWTVGTNVDGTATIHFDVTRRSESGIVYTVLEASMETTDEGWIRVRSLTRHSGCHRRHFAAMATALDALEINDYDVTVASAYDDYDEGETLYKLCRTPDNMAEVTRLIGEELVGFAPHMNNWPVSALQNKVEDLIAFHTT